MVEKIVPDLRFLLTCLLGFPGLLLTKESFHVKLKHIKLQESHLEMLIPKQINTGRDMLFTFPE